MSENERVGREVIRVLIADDQALFRRGLFVVLGTEDGVEVVAEAENGEEAVEKARELAPDVVLMDVRMPKVNGIEAAARIRADLPSTKILMLTVSDEEDDLYEAIKAGARRSPSRRSPRPSGPWCRARASSRRPWPRSCSASSTPS